MTTLHPRLDRQTLTLFRDANGQLSRAQSVNDWLKRRAEILAGMQAVMGPLPDASRRIPLDLRCEEEVDCGSYCRRSITYAAEPGSRVPAYLLEPKKPAGSGAPRPGVLCLMPTDDKQGPKAVVGLGRPGPGHNYGEQLAQRGYVVIAPAYPLLAGYQPDLRGLGYVSGTMKAVWDNIRSLDVLANLSGVPPAGFGAIGHSLGGHNAIFTAVFDERISTVIASCGFDSFLDYQGGRLWAPGQGWAQTRYMPRITDYAPSEIPFDFHELVGALAPRAFFAIAPKRDDNFHWRSAARVVAAASAIYDLHGVPERLRLEHPDCGHEFPPALQAGAFAWLKRFLGPGCHPVKRASRCQPARRGR